MARRTKQQRKEDRQARKDNKFKKLKQKKFSNKGRTSDRFAGIQTEGLGPEALDASSSFDDNLVNKPTQRYNQNLLTSEARRLNRTTATNYIDVTGKDHGGNRQDWMMGNSAALEINNAAAESELLNPSRLNAEREFVGDDMMIGNMGGDYRMRSGPLGGTRREDEVRGANRSMISDGGPTNYNRVNLGERMGAVGVDAQSQKVIDDISESDLADKFRGASTTPYTTAGNTYADAYGPSTRKANDGEVVDYHGGTGAGVNTFGAQALGSSRRSQLKKYSPVEVKNLKAVEYTPLKEDVRVSTTDDDKTIYATGNNPGVKKVTRVAAQYGTRTGSDKNPYGDKYGKDRFSKLAVNEKTESLKVGRTLRKQNLHGHKFGLQRLNDHREKPEKIKGRVDLDMSGSVDTKLERKAKVWAGRDQLFSTRREARRNIKHGGGENVNSIKGRALEYTKDGKKISESDFTKERKSNIKKFNKNQSNYQTAQVNAGAGGATLTGANSYASRMKVDKDAAFGNVPRTRLTNKQTNVNFEKQTRRGKTKLSKFGKQQKRMDRRDKVKSSIKSFFKP